MPVLRQIRYSRISSQQSRSGASVIKAWQPKDVQKVIEKFNTETPASFHAIYVTALAESKRKRSEDGDDNDDVPVPKSRKSAVPKVQARGVSSSILTPGPLTTKGKAPANKSAKRQSKQSSSQQATEAVTDGSLTRLEQEADSDAGSEVHVRPTHIPESNDSVLRATSHPPPVEFQHGSPPIGQDTTAPNTPTHPQAEDNSFLSSESSASHDFDEDHTSRSPSATSQSSKPFSKSQGNSSPSKRSRATSIASSTLATDIAGALSSLADEKWLSATAIDLVLDVFRAKGFRPVDNTFVNTHDRRATSLRIKPDEHTLVQLLLTSNHWTVGFIDLRTGVVEHMDSLQQSGNGVLSTEVKSALERVTALLQPKERFQQLEWRFFAQDCARQDNSWDCGVYMLATVLHRMAGLPQPHPISIDAGLWRKVFRAAITGESTPAELADLPDVPSTGSRFNNLGARQSSHGDGLLGMNAIADINAKARKRYNSFQRDLHRAEAKVEHARYMQAVLSRFIDNAEDTRFQLAESREVTDQALQLDKHIRQHLQELRDVSQYRAGSKVSVALERVIRCYQVPSDQSIDALNHELQQLTQKEENVRRQRDALLAAMKTVEAELNVWSAHTTTLENLVKNADAELRSFFTGSEWSDLLATAEDILGTGADRLN